MLTIYPADLQEKGLLGAAIQLMHRVQKLELLDPYAADPFRIEFAKLEEELAKELPAEMRDIGFGSGRGQLYEFGKDGQGQVWCVIGFEYPPTEGPFAGPDRVELREAHTGEHRSVLVPAYRALGYVGKGNIPPKNWKHGMTVRNLAGKSGTLDKSGRGSATHWRVYWPNEGPTPLWEESLAPLAVD